MRSGSRFSNSDRASGFAKASLFLTGLPCTVCRTANSTIFPDLVRGMSATANIFAGTCRGEAPVLMRVLIACSRSASR